MNELSNVLLALVLVILFYNLLYNFTFSNSINHLALISEWGGLLDHNTCLPCLLGFLLLFHMFIQILLECQAAPTASNSTPSFSLLDNLVK